MSRLRIVVAMSGGVDSSVAAALLKEAGHEVIGITLQLYDHGQAMHRKGACCAGQDIHDARRVADALAIPHYVLDYEARFAATVMDSFAASYAAGETPIPCVTCNQEIKFKYLLETAAELGAEALATGHYIRRIDGPEGPELHRARDAERDQSYFLFATTRAQLARLRFPIGERLKSEVRALARRFALPVADKADSQDICFVPTGRYADIVERLKPEAARPGAIVHVDGRQLGSHDGIINFTVGQRRGLGIAHGEPLYVVALDPKRNEVRIGPKACLERRLLILRDLNWLGEGAWPEAPPSGLPVAVRVRSTQAPRPARLFAPRDGDPHIVLKEGESGVATGQACVFYDNSSASARVLGGGIIARTAQAASAEAAAARSVEQSLC